MAVSPQALLLQRGQHEQRIGDLTDSTPLGKAVPKIMLPNFPNWGQCSEDAEFERFRLDMMEKFFSKRVSLWGQGTGEVEHLPPLGFQDLSKQSHGCPGSPSSSRRLEKTC